MITFCLLGNTPYAPMLLSFLPSATWISRGSQVISDKRVCILMDSFSCLYFAQGKSDKHRITVEESSSASSILGSEMCCSKSKLLTQMFMQGHIDSAKHLPAPLFILMIQRIARRCTSNAKVLVTVHACLAYYYRYYAAIKNQSAGQAA